MFKLIAQSVVNNALPTIKAVLIQQINSAIDKTSLSIIDKATAKTAIDAAVSAWTIKL